MYASLSLWNTSGTVQESNGAVLVLVEIIGQLYTDITVVVSTDDGTGEDH